MKDTQTEQNMTDTPPAPKVHKKSLPSMVWLIPLITALIGGWLIVKTLSEKGPQITVTFKTAEGIVAGKTKIKYKDIEIGVVESASFSQDFSNVILKIDMSKEAQQFLKRGTRFWVVKPRLSLRGASGLSTLVSGAYIEIEPGEGAIQSNFKGLDVPPVVRADEEGRKIVLLTRKLGSIDTGSPIYYQGILAGETLGYELGNDRKSVFVHAFIKAPYDKLIQSNTRFWNVSGMEVSVGSGGVNVKTESMQSLLFGGIAFETPESLEVVKDDIDGLVFTLYDNYKSILEQSFTKKITFVLFFDGSVRGLQIGAPVEFKGIKIGGVTDIRLEFNSTESTFRIPVLIEIEPERVIETNGDDVTSPYQTLKKLVDHGLRARLRSGSLLTGQLFVELDMHPGSPMRLVDVETPFPQLPTIPASLDLLTASVTKILAKMEKIELDKIGKELYHSLASFNTVMTALSKRAVPITENMDKALEAGHEVMEKLNQTLDPNSPLTNMTEEMEETARSIRHLVDMLERNPDSIIFGKTPQGE